MHNNYVLMKAMLSLLIRWLTQKSLIRPWGRVVTMLLVGWLGATHALAQTPCNYRTLTTNNFSGANVVAGRTGGTGVELGLITLFAGSVSNTQNVVDANLTNSGSINTVLGVGSGGRISVDAGGTTVFGAGAIAGYVVGSSSGLGANLLGSVTLVTYLNGTQQESSTSSSLLDLALLSGSGQRTLGFVTTRDFDEVQIRVSSLVSVLTGLPVFYPFVQYKSLTATATAVSASGSTTPDGAVNLVVSGGRSPFTYAWSNTATSQNLTNVAPGTYTVTVTDANGCTTTATATVGVRIAGCPVPGQNGFTAFTFAAPSTNTGSGADKLARYSNVATLNGQSVDIIGDVLSFSSSNGTVDAAIPVNFGTTGTQAQFALYGRNATATVRWTVVKTGTNIPVPFQGSFTVGDLDNVAGNNRLEGISVRKANLFSYKLNTPTNIAVVDQGTNIRFEGTADQTTGNSPRFAVALSFVGLSSFDIVYTKNGDNDEPESGLSIFTFDGNGTIAFDATTVCTPVLDTDGDGVANANDIDDDNDGILDDTEGGFLVDTDSDGISDPLDLDADGDGIPDNIEAQPTVGFVPANTTYTANGLPTAYAATTGLLPINTDGTDAPDYKDLDSDNDTKPDATESGLTLANADADADGLDNAADSNDTAFGPPSAGITNVLAAYPDNGTELLLRVPQAAFTFGNCALATTVSSFVVGTPSTGLLTIPITTTLPGEVAITVAGTGVVASPSPQYVTVMASQTAISVVISYDGSAPLGLRPLTVTAPEGAGSCSPTVSVAGQPDLVVSIGQPTPALVIGQSSVLPVNVTNAGLGATTGPITVTLSLPTSLTAPASFASVGDWGCVTTGSSVTCINAGPITNGTSSSIAVPITPLPTAVGALTVTATVATPSESNMANNTGSATVPIAPTLALVSPANSATVTSFNPPVSGTATAGSSITVTGGPGSTGGPCVVIATGSGNWTCTSLTFVNGPATVTAVAGNAGGLTSPAVSSFVVAVPPTVAVLTPVNSGTASTTPTVSGTATPLASVTALGPNGQSCVSTASPGGTFACASLTFAAGPASITVIAGDANGTSVPAVIAFTAVDLTDTDADGVTDANDLDDDNDGIPDTIENAQLTADVDSDGIPNRLDLDSDNDGINDVREAGGIDANGDGIADGVPGATGVPATAGPGLTPADTDGDTRANPYDLDSDNDGINDLTESGNPLLVDANGDGQVDGLDPDLDGIRGAADGLPATRGDATDPTPADTDGVGGPNYIDLDSDGDSLTDLAESGIPNPAGLDANADGRIDNPADGDGDGIAQAVDGAPAVFGDANSPTLPDSDNDGTPDYVDPFVCNSAAQTLRKN